MLFLHSIRPCEKSFHPTSKPFTGCRSQAPRKKRVLVELSFELLFAAHNCPPVRPIAHALVSGHGPLNYAALS
jgi:hypothetical protein